MNILITGSAGFIGMSVSEYFLKKGYSIIGIDNLNSYYDLKLKKDRNKNLKEYKNYKFFKLDLKSDNKKINQIIKKFKVKIILHFAAQANVRYSLENPRAYIDSNIIGFFNILEACKKNKIHSLIYASSSSVYGNNYKYKKSFDEKLYTDTPKNLYAATKKSNEILAYAYSDLFKFTCIGLRFFTVYGPWGRPDMAPFLFLNSIIKKKKIKIFNNGKMQRDFTYIDDVVRSVYKLTIKTKKSKSKLQEIFNIGRGKAIKLLEFVENIERILKIKSKKKFFPLQRGDMIKTKSNIKKIEIFIKNKPQTNLKYGLKKFTDWYLKYYKVKL